MSKLFFQIGVKDLTPYEDIQNHNVNKIEVFQSWTDGNWIERRAVIRSRIEGRVTLGFASAEDFQEFTVLLNSQRQADGFTLSYGIVALNPPYRRGLHSLCLITNITKRNRKEYSLLPYAPMGAARRI